MSTAATIPVLNPDTGDVHAIPTDQVDAARKAGGKPVATMLDPQGVKRYIPMDQVGEATKAGGKLIPYGSQSSEEIVQDQTGIHPFKNPVAQAVAGGLRAAAGPITGLYGVAKAAFAAPANDEENAAQAAGGPFGLAADRMLVQPATRAHQTASTLRTQGHPVLAAGAELGALPVVGAQGQNLGQRAATGDVTGAVTEGVTSAVMPSAVKAATPPLMAIAGRGAQKSAAGIWNRTVGSRQADFARGANPGRGAVDVGIGPSGSMESIAAKAGDARQEVGHALGNAYADASSSGKLIPAGDVSAAINKVIDSAKKTASSPGVMQDPNAYEDLRTTFQPALQNAAAKPGNGFTPSELWDIRKKINDSLNWGDQSRLNMTRTQQRISGALGGLLEDAVPESADLNQHYQDLKKLENRAQQRANTHSSPLTGIVTKGALTGAGALLGSTTHSPLGAAGGALVGAALDSVPVKTTLASGLGGTGKLLQAAAPVAGKAAFPATLAAESGNGQPNEPGDTENQGSDETPNQEIEQASPSEQSITPAYHPDTHSFSTREWLKGNPGGDPDEAREHAQGLGYTVTD